MANYSITSQARRVVYSGSAGVGPYSFSFPILAQTDIQVYIDSVLKSLTTDYTVNLSTSDGTGNITFTTNPTTPTSSNTITIVGGKTIERTTDFVTAGDLLASSLNTELDALTIFIQQLSENNDRSIKGPITDSTSLSMDLPTATSRANKILSFNSSGVPETTVATTDVSTVAGLSSEITTLSGISSAISGVNAVASNVTTVAGKTSEITSVAAKASLLTSDFVADLNTLAVTDVINDINTLATSDIVSDLNTLATTDVVSDLNTLATSDIISDINTLATTDIVSDLNTLATSDIVSDLNTLATSDIVSDINTLATSDIVTDLSLLATSANVTNMATLGASGVVGNIATVAGNNSNISTVAGISSNISTVAGNNSNISTVASANSNITSVAGSISNVNSVASNISTINDFSARYRVDSSDPTSSLDEGDLAYNTTSNVLKYYNGSAWVTIVAGSLTDIVQDGTPQLGGNLDVNGNSIVSTSNGNIAITPDGSGKVILDGLSYPVSDGTADQAITTDGSGNLTFSTIQASEISTPGNVFSNYNSISTNCSTTTASTKNAILYGQISVTGSATWTVSGNGILQIL